MIDDFSISGINDTASSQNKVDLHMVDTFAAVVRELRLRRADVTLFFLSLKRS